MGPGICSPPKRPSPSSARGSERSDSVLFSVEEGELAFTAPLPLVEMPVSRTVVTCRYIYSYTPKLPALANTECEICLRTAEMGG